MSGKSLRQAVDEALGSLDAAEFHLIALAVLHGMPIREVVSAPDWPQEKCQTMLIGGLRKMRKSLNDAGFSATDVKGAMTGLPLS